MDVSSLVSMDHQARSMTVGDAALLLAAMTARTFSISSLVAAETLRRSLTL
jgi:hypothetical protein